MEKRVVILTGASSGIGLALAERAVRGGFDVVAVGRRAERLERLEYDVEGAMGRIFTLALDITTAGAPETIARAALEHFGRIDILMNNAGGVAVGPVGEQDDGALREQVETHVVAPLALLRETLPSLKERRGQVFFVGSGVARIPVGLLGAYPPAKAAVRNFTRIVRNDLRPYGVAVTYVDPGAVATEFMTRAGFAGPPALLAASPYDVARRIFAAFDTRPDTVNGVPWQTTFVALGEALPWLTDLVLSRVPQIVGGSGAAHAPALEDTYVAPIATLPLPIPPPPPVEPDAPAAADDVRYGRRSTDTFPPPEAVVPAAPHDVAGAPHDAATPPDAPMSGDAPTVPDAPANLAATGPDAPADRAASALDAAVPAETIESAVRPIGEPPASLPVIDDSALEIASVSPGQATHDEPVPHEPVRHEPASTTHDADDVPAPPEAAHEAGTAVATADSPAREPVAEPMAEHPPLQQEPTTGSRELDEASRPVVAASVDAVHDAAAQRAALQKAALLAAAAASHGDDDRSSEADGHDVRPDFAATLAGALDPLADPGLGSHVAADALAHEPSIAIDEVEPSQPSGDAHPQLAALEDDVPSPASRPLEGAGSREAVPTRRDAAFEAPSPTEAVETGDADAPSEPAVRTTIGTRIGRLFGRRDAGRSDANAATDPDDGELPASFGDEPHLETGTVVRTAAYERPDASAPPATASTPPLSTSDAGPAPWHSQATPWLPPAVEHAATNPLLDTSPHAVSPEAASDALPWKKPSTPAEAVPGPVAAPVAATPAPEPPAAATGAGAGESDDDADAVSEETSNFEKALAGVARRMRRLNLSHHFLARLLVRGDVLFTGDVALRWAGMPNKNERSLTAEALQALADAGYLQRLEDERYRVVRTARE